MAGSEPEKYLYNADRQRIATVRGKDAVAERFLHLGRGRQVLGGLDGQGKMTKRYILLPSGQLLAHVDTSGNKPAFYHFDALGSTVVMSDSSSRITAGFVYDPYGARRSVPRASVEYGYVGLFGVVSSAANLSQMGARFYDSSTGLFLSRSEFRMPYWRESFYTYANNNPIGLADPEGLHSISPGLYHEDPRENPLSHSYHKHATAISSPEVPVSRSACATDPANKPPAAKKAEDEEKAEGMWHWVYDIVLHIFIHIFLP